MRGLQLMGHNATLYCLRKTSGRQGQFGYGISFTTATESDMLQLPSSAPTVIIALEPPMYPLAIRMIQRGALLVVHDSTEARRLLRHGNLGQYPIIVVRRSVQKYFQRAYFVPHCYIRTEGNYLPWHERTKWAISLARIDFDKHTDIILEANDSLPHDLRVVLFGGENRLYSKQLCDRWPHLIKQGGGKKYTQHDPTTAVHTAAQYRFMVDMSAICGDGGGTQYTFLEAADAGCVLVINRKWVNYSGPLALDDDTPNEMVPGVNCLEVSNSLELRNLLLSCYQRKDDPELIQYIQTLLQGGRALLLNHSPEVVIPKLISCIEDIYR
jgi:hypothetical protein